MPAIDVVTVTHNDVNQAQAADLGLALSEHDVTYTIVDNSIINRGFGPACNRGAQVGDAPIIGFLNPDVTIHGMFVKPVVDTLIDDVVITGNRFGKPRRELRQWGVHHWVCGATFFVTREFFEERGGFDEQFIWGWEETDLIRQAQACGKRVVSQELPLHHASPDIDSHKDARYKNYHFDRGSKLYNAKWATVPARRTRRVR